MVDSGASMHMPSKKSFELGRTGTLRKSRNPTRVITVDGEVQTSEEAQVYVHDFDFFVTVKILGDAGSLSLGKLCEEHGYTYE